MPSIEDDVYEEEITTTKAKTITPKNILGRSGMKLAGTSQASPSPTAKRRPRPDTSKTKSHRAPRKSPNDNNEQDEKSGGQEEEWSGQRESSSEEEHHEFDGHIHRGMRRKTVSATSSEKGDAEAQFRGDEEPEEDDSDN